MTKLTKVDDSARGIHELVALELKTSLAALDSTIINEHSRANSPSEAQIFDSGYPSTFSPEVYNQLPGPIRDVVTLLEDKIKKDVCLIGIIVALSAAFSRLRFYHGADGDLKEYSPHLIALIVGAAGSGKGLTRHGRTLVQKIITEADQKRKTAFEEYKRKKYEYDRSKKDREHNGHVIDDLIEPTKPKKYCFGMSASDTTQAALVETLHENPVGGFAYDSELDTLTQSNGRKDFGGYSDVIRKVFHHEPLVRQRKGEGETYTVDTPRLSVMLSGTHDQLKKLIPSESNGLFSRIWYYSIPKKFIEYAISCHRHDVVGEMCASMQNTIFEKADLWNSQPFQLLFTEDQEQELYISMQDKRIIEEKYGGDISASWLRMALMVKRIAVTLTGVQGSPTGIIPDNCWRAAIEMLPTMKAHCIEALNIVRSNQGKIELSKLEYERLKANGNTDTQIAALLSVSQKTIQRRKKEWTS